MLPPAGPTRVLSVATLVNTTGNGLFFTASTIFFLRSVGLTPAQVGLGLTIAGGFGLLVGIPAGHLADRVGPREVLVALTLLEGISVAAYVLVQSFAAFLVVACIATVIERASHAVRGGLIAGVLSGEGRVRARAYLRSITNIGISLGSVFAGVALHYDTREAYVALVLANALTYVVTAAILMQLPRVAPHPVDASGPRIAALRDRPFLAVTALNAVLALHFVMLEIAIPVWVVQSTDAPASVVAALFLVNTCFVVALQVRMSRGTDDLGAAARASRRAGVLLLAACVLFGLSAERSAAVAVAFLVLGAVVHVFGEMLQSAGAWGLAFGLAPDHLQGQYQGVFATGFAVGGMLGPALMTALVVGLGQWGWLLLGVVFVVAGVAMVPLGAWAERTRTEPLVATP